MHVKNEDQFLNLFPFFEQNCSFVVCAVMLQRSSFLKPAAYIQSIGV